MILVPRLSLPTLLNTICQSPTRMLHKALYSYISLATSDRSLRSRSTLTRLAPLIEGRMSSTPPCPQNKPWTPARLGSDRQRSVTPNRSSGTHGIDVWLSHGIVGHHGTILTRTWLNGVNCDTHVSVHKYRTCCTERSRSSDEAEKGSDAPNPKEGVAQERRNFEKWRQSGHFNRWADGRCVLDTVAGNAPKTLHCTSEDSAGRDFRLLPAGEAMCQCQDAARHCQV